MSQISTWYNNQYSGAFRSTSRLRAPSLIPSGRVAVNQQTLVVDGRNGNNANAGATGTGTGNGDAAGKDGQAGKRRETIFGPDVGEDDEPGWTQPEDGVKVGVDTVRGWVERAKAEEGLHATTTLQALVNLKRPTLQLLQLDSAPDPRAAIRRDLASIPAGTVLSTPEGAPQSAVRSMSNNLGVDDINPALRSMSMSSAFSSGSGMSIPSAPLHLIKFLYDATSPAVRITLTIHPRLSSAPPVEGKESIHEEEQAEAVRTVYTGIHPGGFNQSFQLPHSAAMDLSSAVAPMPANGTDEDDDKKNLAVPSATRGAVSEDTTRSSYERGMSNMSTTLATVPEMDGAQGDDANTNGNANANAGVGGRVRNLFGRRRRENDVEQGNIEMEERNAEGNKEGEGDEKEEKGMRVLIRIEGVGVEGEALSRRNAQLTHILINGMWVADNSASTAAVDEQAPAPAAAGKRVWVVKVVRREAIIGAHTFLLKEIYGLSTAASTATSTSYPPTGDAADPYASTPNECIVCLTSPRDVVLLPCRHLVVCRECAVGMVEFGAGGKVARREEGTEDATADGAGAGADAATTGATGAAGTGAAAAAPAVAGGTTTGGRERRKKKAKGWYCPVCRQPYTSLLRLALPEVGGGEGAADHGDAHSTHSHAAGEYNGLSLSLTRSRGAASIKSRKSLYLHKVGSRATLPDGAERMLEALRPDADRELDSDDEVEDGLLGPSGNGTGNGTGTAGSTSRYVVPEADRPQFVLGDEVDLDDKGKNRETELDRDGKRGSVSTGAEGDKAEVEHREVANWQAQHQHQQQQQQQDAPRGEEGEEQGQGRRSEDGKKGWKEV